MSSFEKKHNLVLNREGKYAHTCVVALQNFSLISSTRLVINSSCQVQICAFQPFVGHCLAEIKASTIYTSIKVEPLCLRISLSHIFFHPDSRSITYFTV